MRGRSTEGGTRRWFRALGPSIFDQKDIRFESGALEAFFEEGRVAYGLDPTRAVALGYSNGANLLGAAMLLHPGLVQRAILLRPVMVLDEVPDTDLSAVKVLVLLGERDAYRAKGERLVDVLRAAGASVTVRLLAGGHELGGDDAPAISDWMA